MVFSIRWQLVAATAAALTLAFAACGDEKKGGDDTPPGNDAGSPGGGGGLGGLFEDGGIDLVAELEDNVAGSPCTENTDCAGKNATCAVTTPDGTGSCSGYCTEDDNCGAGGKCIKVASFGGSQLSFCAKVCTSDDECGADLQCRKGVDVTGVISEIVNLLDGGVDGLEADETPEICQEKADTVELANGAVGNACTTANEATECGGGSCELLLNPGGYCTGNCLQDSDCGNTGGCARDAISATLGLPGSCRLKCTSDSECREDEGYACLTQELLFGPGRYCAAELQLPDGGFFPDASVPADSGTPAPDASEDEGDAGT